LGGKNVGKGILIRAGMRPTLRRLASIRAPKSASESWMRVAQLMRRCRILDLRAFSAENCGPKRA
jgi:hypothetical protein